MPRQRFKVAGDDDSLPVLVPRNDKAVVPISPERVRGLRKHLVVVLRALRKMTNSPCPVSPLPPEPEGFAARVARTACCLSEHSANPTLAPPKALTRALFRSLSPLGRAAPLSFFAQFALCLGALIYVRLAEGKVDERGFAALKQIGAESPPAKRIGLARFKEIVKEQYMLLFIDAERAIMAIPKLLPDDRRQRQEALTLVRRVLAARGALDEEGRRRLERIASMFAGPPSEIDRNKAA